MPVKWPAYFCDIYFTYTAVHLWCSLLIYLFINLFPTSGMSSVRLGVESSACHPQANNLIDPWAIISQMPLKFHQDSWVTLLPIDEFAYNITTHISTDQIPFFANYGFHPQFHPIPPTFPWLSAVNNFVSHQQVQQEWKAHLDTAKTV